ncbi:Homeobox-leucine zipper protein ROC8 [Orchesella cincta]|uniref:Homeobox-leucine zipper protein ROC8 n=1 Tax=Orchesella cincta TaxID=48709 RepID=A0A1D2MA74_ORCCI|nr:Homeobox-leucine zipper protein ROC8 [Orchesella cincta]
MKALRSVTYLLVLSVLIFHLCVSLKNGEYYHLRNYGERITYLWVEIGGRACRRLGSVGVTSTLVKSSAAFRWQYFEYSKEIEYLDIDWNAEGIHLNEVSRVPNDSNCFTLYRQLNISQTTSSMYIIQDAANGDCLTSNGNDNQIFWNNNCSTSLRSQQWEFVEAQMQ